jgi:uncharacterized protein YrrD
MLIAGQVVYGSAVEGSDAALGSVQDLYYDGESWQVKHVVVDIGGWLENHRVLLLPSMIQHRDWVERRLGSPLTRRQLQDALPADPQPSLPASKDPIPSVDFAAADTWRQFPVCESDLEKEVNLHSSRRTVGFRVEAYDGEVGTVKDVIVDDQSWNQDVWMLRYLVVDARTWLADRFVLISPAWADSLFWDTNKIRVSTSRETIRHSPHYDPLVAISRTYEEMLYDYYGMPKYWARHPV